jgi:hypothetical protein
MKIAFFEIEEWEIAFLQKKLADHTLDFYKEHIDEKKAEKLKDVDILSVFI